MKTRKDFQKQRKFNTSHSSIISYVCLTLVNEDITPIFEKTKSKQPDLGTAKN